MNKILTQRFIQLIEDKYYAALPYMFNSKDAEIRLFLHNQDRYLHTFDLLEKMLTKDSKLKILDIGTSPFTFLLKRKFPNHEVWTIDYDNHLKNRCEKFGIKFIKLDLSSSKKELPRNGFDIITYLEVIEHLKYGYKNSLKLIVSGLKEDGICIVQTPNKNSLKNILLKNSFLKALWKESTIDINVPQQFMHHMHHREFAKNELEQMIKSINKTAIISSSYGLYYDTVSSSLTHRKKVFGIKELLGLYYMLVKCMPFLRADIEIVFSKNWV